MAISPIPNQPINISPYVADECLTGDNKSYCTLYNTNDTLYLQMQNNPCGGELFCNPTFTSGGGNPITVLNFGFDTDLSDWTAGANWTWDASGGAKLTWASGGSLAKQLRQDLVILIPGITYRVSFVVSGYTSTSGLSASVVMGGGGGSAFFYADGSYAFDLVAGSNSLLIFNQESGSDGSLIIDTVEVSPVLDCIYTVPSDWEVGAGAMCHTPGSANTISASGILDTRLGITSGYFKSVVTVENMTSGSLIIYTGLNVSGTITANGEYTFYDLANNGSDFSFEPSIDFDGCVTHVSIFELDLDYVVNINDNLGSVVVDAVAANRVYYVKDRVNLVIPLNGDLAVGCFNVSIGDPCASVSYLSNCFIVAQEHPCAKQVIGSGDSSTASLGFLWSSFQLSHRVRFLKFNPEYPIESDDYQFSEGSRLLIFAKREKYYTAVVDQADENFHDTFSTQILCSSFTIDGVSYFIKPNNYKPEWNKDGRNNLAQARLEARKTIGTIYSK